MMCHVDSLSVLCITYHRNQLSITSVLTQSGSCQGMSDPYHDLDMFCYRLGSVSQLIPLVRPISLLRLSLLRFVDSQFPGKSLRTCECHPLE